MVETLAEMQKLSERKAKNFAWKFLFVTKKSQIKTKTFHSLMLSITMFSPN